MTILLLLRPQQFNPSRPTPLRPRILPHPDRPDELDEPVDIDALLVALLLT